jgi:hypothetical protein
MHFTYKVIQNVEMLLCSFASASQLVDIFMQGLHYHFQWKACMEANLGKTVISTSGTFVLKEGEDLQGFQNKSRWPIRG